MSAFLLLAPEDVEDALVPHEELVRAQRPTPAQVMTAAGVLGGLFPDGSYLTGGLRVSPGRLP